MPRAVSKSRPTGALLILPADRQRPAHAIWKIGTCRKRVEEEIARDFTDCFGSAIFSSDGTPPSANSTVPTEMKFGGNCARKDKQQS